MGVGNTQDGGTQGFRFGALKRRLKPVTIAILGPNTSSTITATARLLLKNLSLDLGIHIMSGIVGVDGQPFRPSAYPANPGTMQLTPISNNPEANGKLWLRPVFQDPAAAVNVNAPLPMNIPFGWEGSTNADEVEIEIVIPNSYANTLLIARWQVQVTVSYKGIWWDQQAVQYTLGQVTLTPGSDTPLLIPTGVEIG